MKPYKENRPEAHILRLLVAAAAVARKDSDAEIAQVAARYESKFARRLSKITQKTP